MRSQSVLRIAAPLLMSALAAAQTPELSKTVQQYVRVQSPRIVLTHVRVIDGTGAPAVEDQNVFIGDGKIAAIQPGADIAETGGEIVFNLRGYSVMPGILACTIICSTSSGRISTQTGISISRCSFLR